MTADASPTITDPLDVRELKRLVDDLQSELDQRRQNEERLDRAIADSQNVMLAQRSALAHVSHEMRNQLQVIDGAVERLQETSLSPGQRECVEQCQSANGLLLALVEDILDSTRIETGHFALDYSSFSPADLVRSTGKLLAVTARHKGLSLDCRIDPSVPDLLVGDPRRIRQVLFNLVGNAVKFTHQGAITISVRMAKEAQAPQTTAVCFSVEDTGIGIPGAKIDAIFEPFVQLTAVDRPLAEGVGLGLAITRKLINLMGGSLAVESCEGKGSRFSFILPLTVPGTSPSPVLPSPEKPSASRIGLRILLAEDGADVRDLFTAFLVSAGHSVATAKNGEEAVDKFKSGGFDLVLMDMQMPVMDGYQATRLIREWEQHRREQPIPVLALTAGADRGDLLRSREAGCSEHLAKPIKKDSLLRAIASHAKN